MPPNSGEAAADRRQRGGARRFVRRDATASGIGQVNGDIGLRGFTRHGDASERGIQCVNIFYPMVDQISERERADSEVVFGAAVVHEIGHLYLGTNGQAHSPTGVMCGVWSHRQFELASIGELNFTREQGHAFALR